MEGARLKLHAAGFFRLFVTPIARRGFEVNSLRQQTNKGFFEMALKLVIGNKNYSSWSMRPWLALRANNIPFDEVFIPLYTGEADKKRILSFTDSGKVPALIDGDVTVWDSLAIIEYVAERFPQTRLWPEDPARRAHARSISAEMHSGFGALRNECGMNLHRRCAQ
jgi:glutathione S-transferase